MTTSFTPQQFTDELFILLSETFESVRGVYLDPGNSLLETLAGISAEEASTPVGKHCATIAAQVTHVCFYLDLLDRYLKTGANEPVDWGDIWRTVGPVDPDEWEALRVRLRKTYESLQVAIKSYDRWEEEHSLSGAMGAVVHAAYHLGEIRQAMCTVRK